MKRLTFAMTILMLSASAFAAPAKQVGRGLGSSLVQPLIGTLSMPLAKLPGLGTGGKLAGLGNAGFGVLSGLKLLNPVLVPLTKLTAPLAGGIVQHAATPVFGAVGVLVAPIQDGLLGRQ